MLMAMCWSRPISGPTIWIRSIALKPRNFSSIPTERSALRLEGKVYGGTYGLGLAGAARARTGEESANIKYAEGRKGGFDPHARIPDMDLDGIDATFLYPSLGLLSGGVQDPAYAAAMCRAYNRWLADYCKPYPDRLFGVAMLPMQSVELAIGEMRFARN